MQSKKISIVKLEPEMWRGYRTLRLRMLKENPLSFAASPAEVLEQAPQPRFWRKNLKDFLDGSEKTMWFALDGEKPVGMIAANREQYQKMQHIWVIHSVYLDPKYRGMGIGKQLFQVIMDEIILKPGVRKINLDITETIPGKLEQQPSFKLYKSFGFEVVGKLKDEYQIDGKFYDVYDMEKYLDD